jgi:flagellum-specific peptidoglycan hydrolase FlgJ
MNSSTAETLSPVPSPSILKDGEKGSSPVPTFAEAEAKPSRRKTAKRKTAKRKTASRRKAAAAATEPAPSRRKKAKRKTAKRKTAAKSTRRRRAAEARGAAPDPSIAAVIDAKRAELKELTGRAKLVEKQIDVLEKLL